jgi:hypothetical protein
VGKVDVHTEEEVEKIAGWEVGKYFKSMFSFFFG